MTAGDKQLTSPTSSSEADHRSLSPESRARATLQVIGTPVAQPLVPSRGADATLSFIDPGAISQALTASGWTVERETNILQEIAEDAAEKAVVRIAACDALRKRILDSLRLSGALATYVAKTSREVDKQGTVHVTEELSVVNKLQGSLEALRQGAATRDVIDVEVVKLPEREENSDAE